MQELLGHSELMVPNITCPQQTITNELSKKTKRTACARFRVCIQVTFVLLEVRRVQHQLHVCMQNSYGQGKEKLIWEFFYSK